LLGIALPHVNLREMISFKLDRTDNWQSLYKDCVVFSIYNNDSCNIKSDCAVMNNKYSLHAINFYCAAWNADVV